MLAIAGGTALASMAMSFWIPFLPLYMRELGARSDASALFWAGLATSAVGVARLISGPFWGVLSDRLGRKVMFVRALAFASGTTAIAAIATEPWHVVVAFVLQGLFSGFVPAAVALTSVSVEDRRLTSSLGMVSAAQYLGATLGPSLGAGVAALFGLREAIIAGGALPAVAALAVYLLVPRDAVRTSSRSSTTGAAPAMFPNGRAAFALLVGVFFFLFAANQLVRLATPVALDDLAGRDGATGLVGVAFTLSGVASIAGLLAVRNREASPRVMLAAGCAVAALGQVALALAGSPLVYVATFALISLVHAVMLPVTNALIAASVHRDSRGTAFGIASSAQALAFMAGPLGAAAFAATSLELGLIALGGAFLAVGLICLAWVRRPLAPTD